MTSLERTSPMLSSPATLAAPRPDPMDIPPSSSAAPSSLGMQPTSAPAFPSLTPGSSTTTFYRRPLPPALHSFTSPQGRRLFREALLAGSAEAYFTLSGNFTMQSEPAFCGLGSLAMVLNALSVDPGKRWKGVWRWYSDDMLECARTEDIKRLGMTFRQFATLARCNGLLVQAKRADQVTRAEFLHDLTSITAGSERHMVVSFSRAALSQTGDGHFSPIAAYHPGERQVLVLDVARFKYPSYFCDVDLLYEAMQPVDAVTNLPRGYFLLSKPPAAQEAGAAPEALGLARLHLAPGLEWQALNTLLCSTVPQAVSAGLALAPSPMPTSIGSSTRADPPAAGQEVVRHILQALGAALPALPVTLERAGVDLAGPATGDLPLQHEQALHQLVQEVRGTPLFAQLMAAATLPLSVRPPWLQGTREQLASQLVLCTILLLVAPADMRSTLPASLAAALFRLDPARYALLERECSRLSHQLDCMLQSNCSCKSSCN